MLFICDCFKNQILYYVTPFDINIDGGLWRILLFFCSDKADIINRSAQRADGGIVWPVF